MTSTKFTNETLRPAVALWRDDELACLQKHGHITHWDTSQVINMRDMFYGSAIAEIYKIVSLHNLDATHPYFNRVRRRSLAIAEVVATHSRTSCQWSNDVAQTLGLVGEIGQFV